VGVRREAVVVDYRFADGLRDGAVGLTLSLVERRQGVALAIPLVAIGIVGIVTPRPRRSPGRRRPRGRTAAALNFACHARNQAQPGR
jgi:hypothetical protein